MQIKDIDRQKKSENVVLASGNAVLLKPHVMIKSKPASYHTGFLSREIVNIKMLDQTLFFVKPNHVVHLSTIILYMYNIF